MPLTVCLSPSGLSKLRRELLDYIGTVRNQLQCNKRKIVTSANKIISVGIYFPF